MIFSTHFLSVAVVLALLAAAGLGALALSTLGLAWYTAPISLAAYALGRLAR